MIKVTITMSSHTHQSSPELCGVSPLVSMAGGVTLVVVDVDSVVVDVDAVVVDDVVVVVELVVVLVVDVVGQ